jgi:hypothetical protein
MLLFLFVLLFLGLLLITKEGFIMDLIFPICCGLDVHKKSVVASIAVTDPVTLEATYIVKSFSTMNSDILHLHDWLIAHNCKDVCMESTGKYWIPVFNLMEESFALTLANSLLYENLPRQQNGSPRCQVAGRTSPAGSGSTQLHPTQTYPGIKRFDSLPA